MGLRLISKRRCLCTAHLPLRIWSCSLKGRIKHFKPMSVVKATKINSTTTRIDLSTIIRTNTSSSNNISSSSSIVITVNTVTLSTKDRPQWSLVTPLYRYVITVVNRATLNVIATSYKMSNHVLQAITCVEMDVLEAEVVVDSISSTTQPPSMKHWSLG